MAPRLIADQIPELLPMDRAPGYHVSVVINHICVKTGKFDGDRGRPGQIQFEMGNAMELAIATALARRYADSHPGRYIHGVSVERDNITGNLDLLDTNDFAVEECKLTKMSIKKVTEYGIESSYFWHYWVQLKAYCYMIGAHTGRLHIVFVNGNYKYDDSPLSGWQYRCWEDTWDDRELLRNWRMILANVKDAHIVKG